jgi:hypothetical protein
MIFLLCTAQAALHPTDSLPVSDYNSPGIHIIIGGDISGELTGSVNNTGTLDSLTFLDDGKQVDAVANDNIYSAHVGVSEQNHDSMLLITNNGQKIWAGTVFGEENCTRTIVKMFLSNNKPVVKIHSCSAKEKSNKTVQSNNHNSNSTRVTAFYNNDTFLQTISGLIFLSVGVFLGLNIRRRRSIPVQYLSTSENSFSTVSRGQKLYWHAPQQRVEIIQQLSNDLSILGPVLLITTPNERLQLQEKTLHGVFINQLDIPTLTDLLDSITNLHNYGPPVVLISSPSALPDPLAKQTDLDVLSDFMHQLSGTVTCIALVEKNQISTLHHTVVNINDIYAKV